MAMAYGMKLGLGQNFVSWYSFDQLTERPLIDISFKGDDTR